MTECERIINSGLVPAPILEEETRSDFTISMDIKKVWTIELDLLNRFMELCAKRSLRYWVGFGMLLRVICHGGFIP